MVASKTIQNVIAEHDVKFVDLRFTGTNGQWHRLTYDVHQVTDGFLKDGVIVDGSSIRGWREIQESDMCLVPDLDTPVLDPFTSQPTLVFFADVIDPKTNAPYVNDPRSIAKKAEKAMQASKIADQAFFGPEPEFFVFDDVQYTCEMDRASFVVRSEEMSASSLSSWGQEKRGETNLGHRPGTKGGYFATSPLDTGGEFRGDMLEMMKAMGVEVEKHHHEVAAAQHELGIKFDTLVRTADNLQIFKYAVKNVAQSYGKTATFMPKPVAHDNGSGMHVHQSLWKAGKSLFSGDKYGGLSDQALYYIGGILKHARALNAFTNPTTNSYKRLIPGFEAPVVLAYSFANRSAACRIPVTHEASHRRVEMRFPDPSANPYLALAAMVMAGLDGIRNKIHPGDAVDENLFESSKDLPHLCDSLEAALMALEDDQKFLTYQGVFTEEMINDYINLKFDEVAYLNQTPHPLEYVMYYSV